MPSNKDALPGTLYGGNARENVFYWMTYNVALSWWLPTVGVNENQTARLCIFRNRGYQTPRNPLGWSWDSR